MNADGEDAEGAIPYDVAAGYSDLLTKFTAVYGDPSDATSTGAEGVLDAANMALAMGIADGLTGPALTNLEEAVDRAQNAYNKALATFNAAAGGPIYQAGAAEWMAQAAVTKSVADYNIQVPITIAAQAALDAMTYADAAAASLWVPLDNTDLFTLVVPITDGMAGDINLAEMVDYANADLTDPHVATVAMGTA